MDIYSNNCKLQKGGCPDILRTIGCKVGVDIRTWRPKRYRASLTLIRMEDSGNQVIMQFWLKSGLIQPSYLINGLAGYGIPFFS